MHIGSDCTKQDVLRTLINVFFIFDLNIIIKFLDIGGNSVKNKLDSIFFTHAICF